MTAARVCPHGMGSPAACTDCMNDDGLGAAPRRQLEVLAYYPAARFSAQCTACNLPIRVGDPLAKMSDETWRHGWCAS